MPSAPDSERAGPTPSARDTFCILPWSHLYVDAAGCALMCCHAKGPISHADGTPVSIYQHTIDEIRNSS